jgi:hypothetical protein
MVKVINGEQPFQVLAHSFSVGYTNGYTLNYSADGVNYTAWTADTPSNEVLICNGVGKDMWFKLVGNTNTATTINY